MIHLQEAFLGRAPLSREAHVQVRPRGREGKERRRERDRGAERESDPRQSEREGRRQTQRDTGTGAPGGAAPGRTEGCGELRSLGDPRRARGGAGLTLRPASLLCKFMRMRALSYEPLAWMRSRSRASTNSFAKR